MVNKKGCATFAYFSVTVNGSGESTTTVDVSADKVEIVTISGNEGPYALKVTADDMAKPENDTPYYAIKSPGTDSDSKSGGTWSSSAQNLEIGTIALSQGSNGEIIECEASIAVSATGTMVEKLQAGDVKFSLANGDAFTSVEGIDLTSLDGTNTKTKTYTDTVTLTGDTSGADTKTIKADVYLINKKVGSELGNEDQSALAGTDLDVTFTFSATCEVKGDSE